MLCDCRHANIHPRPLGQDCGLGRLVHDCCSGQYFNPYSAFRLMTTQLLFSVYSATLIGLFTFAGPARALNTADPRRLRIIVQVRDFTSGYQVSLLS
jgi:hypothetical protein